MRCIAMVLMVVASGCATLGASRSISMNERETLTKEVIDHLTLERRAIEKRDLETRIRMTATDEDVVQVGTDEGEFAVGWKAIEPLMRAQNSAFPQVKFTMRNSKIVISRDGTVAWYAGLVDADVLAAGTHVTLKDMRETGVLEKRNGSWYTMQRHLSIGIAGQAAPYPMADVSSSGD